MTNEQIVKKLADLPLIVRGSPDEVFKRIRELQEAARSCVSATGVAPEVDENSAAFTAYNQAIEDAKATIRHESQGGGYWAATFINAIARKCGPHVYVASLPTKPRTHEAPDPYRPAKAAAEEIVPDCLSRTCFIRGCGYDECWGCEDSKKERERVAAIIERCLAGGVDR